MVRSKVVPVDQQLVDNFAQSHINLLVDMGKYENISKAQQCDGEGLASMQPWLTDLISICPTLEFSSTSLFKKELMAQLVAKPSELKHIEG